MRETVLSAFARNTYNEADVMLESAGEFSTLVEAVKANPSLHVKVEHEADIVEENMQQLNGILNFVSFFVGSIIAIAATIGAANSLYAIVDSRRRELATLRALGFGSCADHCRHSVGVDRPGTAGGGDRGSSCPGPCSTAWRPVPSTRASILP